MIIQRSRLLALLLVAFAAAAMTGCAENTNVGDTVLELPTDTLDTGDSQFTNDPSVPQSCKEVKQVAAEEQATTVGCEFYAHALDSRMAPTTFGIVLANVNFQKDAHYTVYGISDWDYENQSGTWKELKSGTIRPLKEKRIVKELQHRVLNSNEPLFNHPEDLYPMAVARQGAYRIVSDVPIVAYQFNPIFGSGTASSDASTLLPVSTWADHYQVVGYHSVDMVNAGRIDAPVQHHLAYAAIVAGHDNTEVTITPSASLRPGYTGWYTNELLFPGGRDPFTFTLNEADVLYIHADVIGESLSGTIIETDADHPVALFTGHQCAMVPDWAQACDNVEEQLPATKNWGQNFVAARMPNRNRTNHSDPVLWQISAAENNTTVTFQAHEHVKGLPDGEVVLQKGEVADFYVYGSFVHPGDFTIQADKAVVVLQYMTGVLTTSDDNGNIVELGDPAMVYVPPTEQFLSRYVVHVPLGLEQDFLIITRPVGSETYLNDQPVDNTLFKSLPGSQWEVGRLPVKDGNHVVESSDRKKPFGLLIAGMDVAISYAYSGGMGFDRLYTPK